MPDHVRISEVRAVDIEHGIALVCLEGVAIITAISNSLVLSSLGATWVLSKSVDGHYAVVLVGEEAGSVVRVENCGAAEHILQSLLVHESLLEN